MQTWKRWRAGVYVLALAGGILPPWTALASPLVRFREDFRNYRDQAPGFTDGLGIRIGNDPIWTQRAEANCQMTASGFLFKSFAPVAEAGDVVRDYDVLFDFRFPTETDGRMQIHLRHDLEGHPGDVIVTISSGSVAISSEGIRPALSAEATLVSGIPTREWQTCAITARDGRLKVLVTENRVLKPVLDIRLPPLALAGINVYGFKEMQFGITRILVRDPAPLPDNSIVNLLPAPRKIDAGAFVSGGSRSVPANDIFGATIRTGLEKEAVKVTLPWSDGRTNVITFSVAGIPEKRKVRKDGKDVAETYERPDALIQVRGLGGNGQVNYYIRPLLRRYKTGYEGGGDVVTDTYRDIVRDWDLLPGASGHPLQVEFRRTAAGVDVYLDSCFAGSLTGAVPREAHFTLASSASLGYAVSRKAGYDPVRYLPLDTAALGMAKSFAAAEPSLAPGFSSLRGIPLAVASGAGSADIGLAREGQGNWALEVDEYLARSPFDGLLTEIHFTVPGGVLYTRAWVLCAVDPDPAKDPVLTTRIARYVENGSGANQLADTVMTLPRGGEKPGEGIVQVGTVAGKGADGKPLDVPLYLVEVPLKSGEILDLLMDGVPMNFEFIGKRWENFEQIDNSCKPDPKSTSAVQVFGVTLEKAPFGMQMIQSQPSNIFHNDEKPETTVRLRAIAPCKGRVAWTIRDAADATAGQGTVDYAFSKAGETLDAVIPLRMAALGWYGLGIEIQDGAGKPVLVHPAAFALLGRDGRKARYESPFGTWWFDGAHNTPKDPAFAGPVMFKAGIRMVAWTSQSEKSMEPWFITKDSVGMPFTFNDLATAADLAKDPGAGERKKAAAIARAETAMDKAVQAYPHLREVTVFHESGPDNSIPVELIGLKPELSDAQRAREKRYADLLNLAGAFFRERYPRLRLVVGNNSASASCIAAVLRHGGNPDYIDAIGIEAPSQVFIPEKLQEWAIQGSHIAKDTAKVISGRDIPATGCYEFTYRSERDMGEQQQAEWYARDVLIALANNFTRIGPGILFDTSTAYYNGLWGASGILRRGPHGYPKRAYVAYAVLTSVFDQAGARRQVPTGSTTLYALEAARADGQFAVALWAARGDAEFLVDFAGDTPVRVVDMYGRPASLQKTDGGKLTVTAGTSPAYILAGKPVRGIATVARSFPEDDVRARLSTVVAPFDQVATVTLDTDPFLDTPKVAPLQLPIRQRGEFELRQAVDDQKGDCIELELKTDKDLGKYITEYTTLRLDAPAAVSGTPAGIGVWVKGNSNWGRVLFEIEDAEGEVWRSVGTGGWGCDVLDWPGNAAVNFDGWNFVALPLRDTPLFHDHSPGPVLEQWVSGGGNKTIDMPIKVRALIVEMNRQPLDLVDFKAAVPVIRLKDASVF